MRDKGDVVVGVDIGGTKTALMLCDALTGRELDRASYDTPADAPVDRALATLTHSIGQLLDNTGRPSTRLQAVGVAVPGSVAAGGIVIEAGNLKDWRDLPLGALLRERFDCPVWVEHDANAAAIGEHAEGSAQRLSDFVFLAVGTGLGAGIFIDGRLLRGHRNRAGEVGDLVMGREFFGTRGDQGNLATLIGGAAIRDEAKSATGAELGASDALAEAESDTRLEAIAERTADFLAIAIIAITALLDPEAIIFGGGTGAAGAPLLDRVRARVARELPAAPNLLTSALGADAQLRGAVVGARSLLAVDDTAR